MESTSSAPEIPPVQEIAQTPGPSRPGCLTYALFAGAAAWIILVTWGIHGVLWAIDQTLLIEGIPMPWFAWPVTSWMHGLALALPVVPLAIWTRAPRLQAAYRTWAIATGALFVLGLARAFPMTWNQPAALAQIVLSLACAAGLLIWSRAQGRKPAWWWGALAAASSLAIVVALPWLAWGALGSPLDALLNLGAGVSLGLLAGILLDMFLFRPLAEHTSGPGTDIAFGGLAAGIALLILGSGFGFNGSQLLLMLSLPLLGIAVAAITRFAGPAADARWLPVAALVGLAAAAPLMFIDPEELSLILGDNDILTWALRAAALSLLLAGVVGLVLWALRGRINGPPRTGLALGALAVTWLGGLLLYLFVGQPGFYGEQLFVILRSQADLGPARSIADRGERLRYVYTTLTRHADTTQAGLRTTLDLVHAEYQPYYLVNAIEVNGGPILRAYLSRQPEVDRILDSQHLRPLPQPVPVSTGDRPAPTEPQWNITSIGADRVWNELGVTGKGIVVGQSDSGVQGTHPALRDTYRGRDGQDDYNWLDPWNQTRQPSDIGGHGTHTLGSILGQGGIGVAPDAEWFGCVNLARNLGDPAWYLDCMQFMLAPYPQGGNALRDGDPARAAHVINNSWGCPPIEGCDANSLAPAVSALRAAGIFVVASAGNEGPRCGSVSDPIALYADAFSVGAVDQYGSVAFFSSRGPVTVDGSGRTKPDILAPGVDVLSSMPRNTYTLNSGTSMAGPHVVGVVALMWSAQPKLIGDIDRTEQILQETARPYTGPSSNCSSGGPPDNDAGYGLVDAYAAVKAAMAIK
jgi:subtilisin family serine protease